MFQPQEEMQRAKRNFVPMYNVDAPVDYQTRVVVFFDVLGWGQAVEQSETDPALRQKLLNAVWSFAARAQSYVETETAEHRSRDEWSQFSDSVIVSFPYTDYRDLIRLLRFVTEFQSSMLLLGLPLRGGVTVGSLFHTDAIAFGPAMNRAHHLESKIARVPRVIVDPALNDAVRAAASVLPKHWQFVVRGDDSYYETDFLTGFAMSEKLAHIIEGKIDSWIEQYRDDVGVFEKYLWLRARWKVAKVDAIDRVKMRDKFYSAHKSQL